MDIFKKLWRVNGKDSETVDAQLFDEVQAVYTGIKHPASFTQCWERLQQKAAQTPQLSPIDNVEGSEFPPRGPSPPFQKLPFIQILYLGWMTISLFLRYSYRSAHTEYHWQTSCQYIDLTTTHLKASVGLSPI